MITETLFYIAPANTDVGVMPGYYWMTSDVSENAEVIAAGGKDVSNSKAAWAAYSRFVNDCNTASA